MIDEEARQEIRRLFYAEHWKIGTIAANLGVHPDAVRRAVETERFNKGKKAKPSRLDPYHSFIERTLEDYPKVCATRLFQMLTERGYDGSVYPLRRFIAGVRPRFLRAYQDLVFLPGEMAQVDWAEFGRLQVGRSCRKILCFVTVLAHSRMLFARMFYDQKLARVLEGHVDAFRFFGGVPRVCLYDNMKTAVLENFGQVIRFNRELSRLADHYHFNPRACNPRSGWEKGRVERAVRYVRDNFFAARHFVSLADLNGQLDRWLKDVAPNRAWPDDTSKTVGAVFKDERLLSLPGDDYPVYEERAVVANKKAFVHFDSNRYSLPPEGASKNLTVRANFDEVSIYDGSLLLCTHPRSWSRGEKIVAPEHQMAIAARIPAKEQRRSRSILISRLPGVGSDLLRLWAELDENLSSNTSQLLRLAGDYGVRVLEEASREAIARGTPRADSIRFILQNASKQPENTVKIKPRLLRRELEDIEIRSHDLSTYDTL